MSDKVNIIINGKHLQGKKGDYILTVAKENGIEIPTLCNDPRLEPYSSCFVCVVEVKGMKGLQPACSTRINEGMEIETENEKVKASRKSAMDLIMSNHYADCVAPCKETCPAGVDVQGYISLIEKGLYSEAVELIKEDNPLPAVCGRVCVRPCEAACRRNLLDENTGVGIDYMKRFAADYDLLSQSRYKPEVAPSTGKKVAIIGAGPGGLSAAYWLQQKGHQCDIFEAAPYAGGWLRYGIPEYRLPNDLLDKEIQTITELGVNIHLNKKLGDNLKYKELEQNYDSVILTIGSQRGTLLRAEGEDADGVFSGIDFLRNMEMTGQRYDFTGKKILVVGGGNTAMDCCRTSIRCGSTDVKVIYRRTEKEMPANPIEIHESKLEGVEYLFLNNPLRVNKTEDGRVKSVTLVKMELGAPDDSGRRRPVPIEGSEYELEADYILAAIGQKTDINFLEDVNSVAKTGELKANRWGDIDADPKTLQTGIPSIFAAGDGVSGPATIIEAIAQAKIAVRSCHQYLSGEELVPEKKEFLSKKDNFKKQEQEDYLGRYQKQLRHEMPVLDADKRLNFNEVELGYNEQEAQEEAARCLECGCSELYTCDLKKIADKYDTDQSKYAGDYKEYSVDFSHAHVEIDSNKCILCSRCIRICKEVVGANALGLINRGFDTFVAPALGHSLNDTNCESCGLCISACPTGAITENILFKRGPIKTETKETICNYCSIGCSIELHTKSDFVMQVTGLEGQVNKDGNLCKYAKFGYNYINDKNRITKPMHKENGEFKEIAWNEAIKILKAQISEGNADDKAFFAGARLTNEEMYLIQRLAREKGKTNYVNSFHYLQGASGYQNNVTGSVSVEDIPEIQHAYLFGADINADNAVAGFMLNSAKIPQTVITEKQESSMQHKVNELIKINSYYAFAKAVNYYLLDKGLQNQLFIDDNTEGFELYKEQLLKEDYNDLCRKAGVEISIIENFAKKYNEEHQSVIIFSEKEVTQHTSQELINLALITGKLGKKAAGILSLKAKNNSQGLFDTGVRVKTGPALQSINDDNYRKQFAEKCGFELPEVVKECMTQKYKAGDFKKLFVFGEDPVGCATDAEKERAIFAKANFVMVQDYFMTETAKQADLIIPASLPTEIGGSFTNTQKVIQEFDAVLKPKTEQTSYDFLSDLLENESYKNKNKIRSELFLLLSLSQDKKHQFEYSKGCNCQKLYKYGCDNLVKRFEEEF